MIGANLRLGPVSTEAVMLKRRRFKQAESLHDRLATRANRLREQIDELPDGPEREALLKKLRQADTASHIEDWANSPGLQPPTQ